MDAILHNFPLLAAFLSMILAQAVKVPIHWIIRKSWNPLLGFSTGGMPSSHSAAVVSLTTAVGLTEGLASSSFAIAVVVSAITMYDAAGIRRHAGLHAAFLNRLVRTYSMKEQAGEEHRELKEMLGHRPVEVIGGVVLGVLLSFILYAALYR